VTARSKDASETVGSKVVVGEERPSMRRIRGDRCLRMTPQTVTVGVIARASEGHLHCHRSRLGKSTISAIACASGRRNHRCSRPGQSWPPRRSRLKLPLDDIAWGRRRLETPLASRAAGSRRRCPCAAHHR
jgi:hypothetical protein